MCAHEIKNWGHTRGKALCLRFFSNLCKLNWGSGHHESLPTGINRTIHVTYIDLKGHLCSTYWFKREWKSFNHSIIQLFKVKHSFKTVSQSSPVSKVSQVSQVSQVSNAVQSSRIVVIENLWIKWIEVGDYLFHRHCVDEIKIFVHETEIDDATVPTHCVFVFLTFSS